MRVLSLVYDEKKNAGPKAPADIDKILKEEYAAKTVHVLKKGKYKYKVLWELFKCKLANDVTVIQYPLIYNIKAYKLLNVEKTIVLIHDINGLRNQNEEFLANDIRILSLFRYIVVHNERMKAYLADKGIPAEHLYVLELFDYLVADELEGTKSEELISKEDKVDDLEIIYPGNLSKEKSPFVHQLEDDKLRFKLNLYGLGIDKDISSRVVYKGSFEPDNIGIIKGDVGLIWDGNRDESDEANAFKNYTRYNNPHKLSCCMALGVPVIVWEKAAIADFVKKYDIGYTIRSIYEINDIDFTDISTKKENALAICDKVRNGYFTKRVIKEVLGDISKHVRI